MTAPAQMTLDAAASLPALRRDLQIELVAERGGRFPAIVVTDPVRGTYTRLAWPESGILLHWQEARTIAALQATLVSTYGVAVSPADVAAVVDFAFANQLTEADSAGTWHRYAALRAASEHSWLKTLIHGYLFFRLPLVNPQDWLMRMLPRVEVFYSAKFWLLLSLFALVTLHYATRQWTALVSAMAQSFRLEGLAIYAIAVLCLKGVHELGHAFTTVRYGCRVPSMGIAVMLGAPVLYTDTTDSWRLAKRSERLAIVFGGVAAEAIAATVALALWLVLPDGLARQLSFAFATTSIALSLAVNLNPFMRFDGYFAFSDYLEVPNLQPRAFSLMLWKLREILFGLGHPPPEQWPRQKQRILIGYALITAFYRFFLYIGIAAVVYAMAGKAIGIVLGLFEIIVFIAAPVWREVQEWWTLRSEIISSRRSRMTMTAAGLTAVAAFVPWIGTVDAPVILGAEREAALYLRGPAQLTHIAVVDGQTVKAGELLFTAVSPDLEHQAHRSRLEAHALKLQVSRQHASEKERELRGVTESRLARALEKVGSMDRQIAELEVRAPFDGRIVDLDPDLSAPLYVNHKRQLARVVTTTGAKAQGLVAGADVQRINRQARAWFIPDDPTSSRLSMSVSAIAPASDGRLSEASLGDQHGGTIAVSEQRGELLTRHGWFAITLESAMSGPPMALRGVVHIEASRVSPATLIWRQVMRVAVRESGF